MAIDLNQINPTQSLLRYLRQQRENKRFIDAIEVAITFFTIALFGFFALRPTFLTISTLIGENKAKTTSIAAMKIKINNIVKAQDNFAKIQDDFPLIESSLPSNPNYGDVATQIEGIALKTGFPITSISYGLNKENTNLKAPVGTNIFSVSSTGNNTFAITNNFIGALLKNRRLLDFTGINFTIPKQQQEGQGSSTIDFNFGLTFLNFITK